MTILFLAKRHPQQRDLIERPYGRFFHLPHELALRGHDVRIGLLSHRNLPAMLERHDGVEIRSDDLSHPFRYIGDLSRLCTDVRPDWIVGCSDIYYGIAAVWLARRCGARAAIDAYDNFESYMPWAKPLHWLWHRALRKADLVTAAGPQLAELLQARRHGDVHVLPMSADPGFAPANRLAARQRLRLPVDAKLVGHCGSFTDTRGSAVLLEAFARVREKSPDARLVLTGRYPEALNHTPNVVGLGMVADDDMPVVLASLDVACVLLADTAFGRYSYPAKLYEAIACGIPVVASATEPVRWILDGAGDHLARVGDAQDLAAKIIRHLEQPSIQYPARKSWSAIATDFESLLNS